MGTTTEKLTYLQGTKDAIKDAIVAKGVEVPEGTTFRGYAEKVGEIPTGEKTATLKISGDALTDPKAVFVDKEGILREIKSGESIETEVIVGTLVVCSNSIQMGAIDSQGEIESVLSIRDDHNTNPIYKVNGNCEIIFYITG